MNMQNVSAPSKMDVVAPASGKRESRWVLSVAVCISLFCAAGIGIRNTQPAPHVVDAWQINAFTDLSGPELGTYNALRTAALEIEDVHKEQQDQWMTLAELTDLYIPPFIHDAAWRKAGKLRWSRKVQLAKEMHIAMYLGNPQESGISGSFLLLMLHNHIKKQGNAASGPTHAPFEVWYHSGEQKPFPEMVTDQALIAAGWREVVALEGKDEVKRMKGRDI